MADKEVKETQEQPQEKMLPQTQVNAIVEERLARERQKYADYEDLRKFKTEHEKQLEKATQKELEAKKEYEKLKEGWQKKEEEYKGLVQKKDLALVDMKISTSLLSEVTKQNAYVEETMAMLKNNAIVDTEGNIRIKGKDVNGMDSLDTVEEGVKKFLSQRPHLVKASNRQGAGTPPLNMAGAGQGAGVDDLATLNSQVVEAQARGEYKKAKEINKKIRERLTSSGISLNNLGV